MPRPSAAAVGEIDPDLAGPTDGDCDGDCDTHNLRGTPGQCQDWLLASCSWLSTEPPKARHMLAAFCIGPEFHKAHCVHCATLCSLLPFCRYVVGRWVTPLVRLGLKFSTLTSADRRDQRRRSSCGLAVGGPDLCVLHVPSSPLPPPARQVRPNPRPAETQHHSQDRCHRAGWGILSASLTWATAKIW